MEPLKSIAEATAGGGLVSIANVMDAFAGRPDAVIPVNDVMDYYRCHKRVKAARITSVAEIEGGMSLIIASAVDPELELPYAAPDDMLTRYRPVAGDYLVMYEGGHVSISPKDAFDGGYTLEPVPSVIPEYQQRVLDEKAALDEKMIALDRFICSEAFLLLNPNAGHLLKQQSCAMAVYSSILGSRISDFTE